MHRHYLPKSKVASVKYISCLTIDILDMFFPLIQYVLQRPQCYTNQIQVVLEVIKRCHRAT